MDKDEWGFDAEACCNAIKEHMQWEYNQMRLEDGNMSGNINRKEGQSNEEKAL